MAHFAQIDENNIVIRILVIEQEEINTGNWGNPNTWIQTSYNTRAGVHYTPIHTIKFEMLLFPQSLTVLGC